MNTKKDIIQRLFTDGHITFDEMWVLLQNNENVTYIPMPYPYSIPYPYPVVYQPPYVWTTSGTGQVTSSAAINSTTGELK